MTAEPIFSLRSLNFIETPKRVAVLASGNGTNFRAIAEAKHRGDFQFDIVGLIYNNPDAGCASIADEFGIAKSLINHRNFDSAKSFDYAVNQQLREWECDFIAMAGWMRIATPFFVRQYPNRIVNLHPSLLPSFKGLHAIEQAFNAGVAVTGCTVHLVTDSLDDGPILGQAAISLEPNDTIETLTKRIHAAEHRLYPLVLAHL